MEKDEENATKGVGMPRNARKRSRERRRINPPPQSNLPPLQVL
jgi:hypothetical protein